MPTAYEHADESVLDRMNALLEKYHQEVVEAGVTIEVLMASSEGAHPIMHGGYPADGLIRIVSLKDRVKGCKDVEMLLDKDKFEEMSDAEKDALIDHELEHIVVVFDEGAVKTDDIGRPKIRMKKHDVQVGWFREIALRHGVASGEVKQARLIFEKDGQAFFPFVQGTLGI